MTVYDNAGIGGTDSTPDAVVADAPPDIEQRKA
jgi:hypothetical protein